MLSDDDLNLHDLTEEELESAWELWFDLAQTTNEWDPPYEHGVFAGLTEGRGSRTGTDAAPPAP
jgi:hypothetical protein